MPLSLARGVVALLMVAGAATAGGTPAQAARPTLSLSALAFADARVDATDRAANTLTWTIKDTDPAVEFVQGTVTFRMRSTVTGRPMGHEYAVNYDYGGSCCTGAEFVAGTPQESTYRYRFPVPRYADAPTAVWEVTAVTARDSARRAVTVDGAKLRRFGHRFTATTLVDSTGPSAGDISLGTSRYVYAPGTKTQVLLDFRVQDAQSGFWKGALRLAGPAGQTVSTSFQWEQEQFSTGARCGRFYGDLLGQYMNCGIEVQLPANAAAGSWRVDRLVLVDNAGARTTYQDPQGPTLTVTSNELLRAGDFANSPETVDNWRGDVAGEITMTVTGARDGVSSVAVVFGPAVSCAARALPASVSGTKVTVPVRISQRDPVCEVTGLAIVDGAGTVALYGSEYGAPEPGLTFRRKPNTTPPVALGASLDPATVKASESSSAYVRLTVRTEILTAPIGSIEVYLYDSAGTVVSQSGGGTSQGPDGAVERLMHLPWEGLEPGAYTVGFALSDEGDLRSWWGMPDMPESKPVPGGPVTLTVTAE